MTGVRVEGLSRVVRDLKRLGLDVSDLKDAFAQVASEAAQVIEAATPKRTGRLAASVRGNRAQSKAVVRAGGARVPYAGPINYGWAKRGIEPARFMQAADSSGFTATVVRRLEAEIEQAITRRGLR